MEKTIQGKRIYWTYETGFGLKNGEYGKNKGIWFCVTPNGLMGDLSNHDVTEHEDGTISVSPSILVTGEKTWHGYLERGIWREV